MQTITRLVRTFECSGVSVSRLLAVSAVIGLATMSLHAQHKAYHETNHATLEPGIPAYTPVKGLSGELVSVGADTMESLMKLWIEDFDKVYPDVHFTMEAKASGTAGPALTAGRAQLGPVAREMLPAEEDTFKQKYGYEPLAIAVAGGSYRTPGSTHAIAFFVNRANPISQLTLAQLDAIFSTTRKRGCKEDIKTWGQLGLTGEWANAPIHLYGLIRPNGIAHFLQLRILQGGDYKQGIREYTTVGSLAALDAIAQEIAKDRFGIGYSGFSSLTPDVKAVALAEADGGPYYTGTFQEVVSQEYPLSRFVYIYVNKKPEKPLDPMVREFLKFTLSNQGQEDVIKQGVFLPLPPRLLATQQSKLN
jgi:phosphate transport system substrate-binding protein